MDGGTGLSPGPRSLPIPRRLLRRIHTQYRQGVIAVFTIVAIAAHLVLRYGMDVESVAGGRPVHEWPLLAVLALGGIPLVFDLLLHRINILNVFGSTDYSRQQLT